MWNVLFFLFQLQQIDVAMSWNVCQVMGQEKESVCNQM